MKRMMWSCSALLPPPPPAGTWESCALTLAMAAHARLGEGCAQSVKDVARSHDLLLAIMRHVTLIVPDDTPTLAAALRRAAPWQRVLIRHGEHLVDGRTDGAPGSSLLRVARPVDLCGEDGTVLHGTLILDRSCPGGAVRNLRIDDGGDCCVRCEGGCWEMSHVRLRCSHGSALLVSGPSRVTLEGCVLGGEGDAEQGQTVMLSAYGSVQEARLHKRACFAIVAKGDARIEASRCTLRECSEAAVLLANASLVSLAGCLLTECAAAFLAGEGLGKSLRVSGCHVDATARRLWADADRPLAFEWGEANRREEHVEEEEAEDAIGDAGIVRLQQPRGAAADDSSDTDSLQDASAFADMEALMEELDNAALAASG